MLFLFHGSSIDYQKVTDYKSKANTDNFAPLLQNNLQLKQYVKMAEQQKSKALHISLWIAQVLLAFAFSMAGFMKVSLPIPELAAKGMGFVNYTPEAMVRFIGIAELLGALGLILPSALRIKPILTPLAAVGIAVIMILAAKDHLSHNESIMVNVILFALAAFVAWGRFSKVPIIRS